MVRARRARTSPHIYRYIIGTAPRQPGSFARGTRVGGLVSVGTFSCSNWTPPSLRDSQLSYRLHTCSARLCVCLFVISGPKWEDPWKQLLRPKTQKRDETPSSRNETPSSPDRPTTRRLLIAATTRLRPPDVRSANESSVVQVGSSTNAATSCL